MTTIMMSTKGQLVIPKALRDAKGFTPGVALEAIDHPDGVLVKVLPQRKKGHVSELSGMLKHQYKGPPISIEKMNQAIEEAANERYLRSQS